MSFCMSFCNDVDEKIADEFKSHLLARMDTSFDMLPGDLVKIESKITGKQRLFVIRQRVFSVIPDEDGRGLVEIMLGEPSETELQP